MTTTELRNTNYNKEVLIASLKSNMLVEPVKNMIGFISNAYKRGGEKEVNFILSYTSTTWTNKVWALIINESCK